MAPPRSILLLAAGLVLVALALYGAFGGGAAPEGAVGSGPDATSRTADGRQADLPGGPEAAAAEGVGPAAEGAELGRREVAAETVLRGAFRAPSGRWPGGGRAELHPPSGAPEGGFMGMMTAGIDMAKQRGRNSQESEATMRRWFGRTEPVAATEVGPHGAFRFADPPAGAYELRLSHPHLRDREPVAVEVEHGTERDLGVIETRLAGSILVLVADAAGKPIEGARLELGRTIDPKQFMDPSVLEDMSGLLAQIVPFEGRTDERGAYLFEGLDPDVGFKLRVRKPDYVEVGREVRAVPGRERVLRVSMSTGGTLRVTVLDPDGEPFEGARIRVRYPDIKGQGRIQVGSGFGGGAGAQSQDDVLGYSIRTGADGVAEKSGLPSARAEVLLRTTGYLRDKVELRTAFDETATATFELDPGLTVSGRVIDEQGQPIPHARVVHMALLAQKFMGMDVSSFVGLDLLSLGSEDRGVGCDEDGHFVLGGFGPGEQAVLVATAEGYDPNRADEVAAGSTDVEIELLKACSVSGTVVRAEDGTPVSDFEVALQQRAFLVFDRPVVHDEFSGREDGSFALEPCPRERFKLIVEADGRAPWTKNVNLANGSADLGEIRLDLPGAIEGVTLAPDGTPLAGVQVRIGKGGPVDSLMMAKMLGQELIESDDDGRFRIDGLSGGGVRLLADKEGFAPVRSKAIRVRVGETVEGVVLQLTMGGSIRGRIVDEAGEGLRGWRVQAAHTSGRGVKIERTDETGAFLIEGLASGNYKVDGFDEDFVSRTAGFGRENRDDPENIDIGAMIGEVMKWTVSDRVVVREGEESELTLVFEAPEDEVDDTLVEVAGRVRVGGRALASGSVSLFQAGGTMPRHIAQVADGKFTIDRVRPGAYRAQVQAGLLAGTLGEAQSVRIPAGDAYELALELPGGRLEGRAIHREDGEPAAGIVMTLTNPDAGGGSTEKVDIGEGTVLTGADGGFRFDGLRAGVYEVFGKQLFVAGGVGESGRLSAVALGPGEVRTGLVLELDKGGEVRVDVRDGAEPRRNALVSLLDAAGRPVDLFHRALTDREGTVQFQGVPEGDYRVAVDAPGAAPRASEPFTVVSGVEQQVSVSLEQGVAVSLEVVGDIPDDLRGDLLLYAVWRSDGAMLRSGRITVPRALDAAPRKIPLGRYEPGTYRLRVEGELVGIVDVERTVRPGDSIWQVDVDAELRDRR